MAKYQITTKQHWNKSLILKLSHQQYKKWTQGRGHSGLLGNFPFQEPDLLSGYVFISALKKNKKHPLQTSGSQDSYRLTARSVSANTHATHDAQRQTTNVWQPTSSELFWYGQGAVGNTMWSGIWLYVLYPSLTEETMTLLVSWPTYNLTSVAPLGFCYASVLLLL